MKSSKQIREELLGIVAKAETLQQLATQENREFSAEENAEIDALSAQQGVLNSSLDRAIKYETLLTARMDQMSAASQPKPVADVRLQIPIKFAKCEKPEAFDTIEDAYRAGQFILAVAGNRKAKAWCKEHQPIKNAHTTGDNTSGGFLVPEPLEAAIIAYRQQFGVFGQFAQQWVMTDSVQNVPKLTGEMTSYYVGENMTITPSDMSFGLVRLEAKKLAGVGVISSELNEDAVVSVADAYALSCAQKFSFDEDNAGFNGDGTSAFGGIAGANSVLAAGSTVTATGQTTVGALTMASFEAADGALPEIAGMAPAWYMHKRVYTNSAKRLMNAVGGNDNMTLAAGAGKEFLGYPVRYAQALASAPTSGQTFAYFGDLRFASILGRRRGLSVKLDSSIYVLQDALALIATQRYDINVHDRGTSAEPGVLLKLVLG